MNTQELYAGKTDTPLTDEGKKQVKKAGQQAKDLGIDLILCSPLSRAYETAKIIAKEIGYPVDQIEVVPDLIERNFGALEGTKWSKESPLKGNVPGTTVDIDGIEQIEEILERAAKVVAHSKNHPSNAKHVLLVAHGAIGRALRYHVVPEADYQEAFPNAELMRWI